MPTDPRTKIQELLKSFDVAMLVTHAGDGEELHSRPMAIAHVADDLTTWFVTSRTSPKTLELTRRPGVQIVCQKPSSAFLALSGSAYVVDDRAELDRLWKKAYEVWFPQGKEDPDLALLRVTPERGEYWDERGAHGASYAIEALRAFVSGTRPKVDDVDQHGVL